MAAPLSCLLEELAEVAPVTTLESLKVMIWRLRLWLVVDSVSWQIWFLKLLFLANQKVFNALDMHFGVNHVVGLRNDEHQRHKIESTSRASISMIRDQVNITSKAASTSQLQVFLLAGTRCSARKSLHI